MILDKPFIHTLKTPLCNYVYDVNTNQFIVVDDYTYQYFRDTELIGEISLPNARVQQNIEDLQAQGFLSTKRPKEIHHSHSDLMTYHLNENLMTIALQVTQQCNFRCAYCAYCASDFELQRNHSSKRMPFETALAAIDFFAARCGNQEMPTIAFYGGEPLLEFPLIQRVTTYAEEKIYGKKVMFTVTTNASLLTPEIARFFSEHNFSTLISLDGTSEIHDRSRRFASTGQGSFTVIRENLENVKKQCPDFSFSFNVVIDPRYPCDRLYQLFNKDELFQNARFRSTWIDDRLLIEKTVPGEIFMLQNSFHTFKSYLALRGEYDKDGVSRVAKNSLLARIEKTLTDMKPSTSLPDVIAPGGPCISGERRLFVDVDGELYPCERVSETSQAMNIGNLRDGFDFDKVDKILNIAQTTAEDCKDCWAFRHCKLCCAHSDNFGELSADLRRSQCENVRNQVEDEFKDYLWMKEFNVSSDMLEGS